LELSGSFILRILAVREFVKEPIARAAPTEFFIKFLLSIFFDFDIDIYHHGGHAPNNLIRFESV
jgi:hypothetical protein